jgi:hypothetical protein
MVSLVDIGPLTENVPYRGTNVPVTGLTALGLFELLKDIPELRKLMAERQLTETDISSLVMQFPQAVATIIVSGMGNDPSNNAEVGAAMKMSAGEQALFIAAILKLTFPQGVTNFVESLVALLPKNLGAPGWDQATKSQEPSKNASITDTESKPVGSTHQDS